ncbi:MAG TPA: response regulator transcription factor [Coleofasciculaceae cyanobacterium]
MKILLVEDATDLSAIFKTLLTAQRYAVDLALDGQAGWELATSQNYDLIILDVMLPKLDGISLCRKLRSQGKQTPILILTSRGTKDDKITGLDAGADDYLIKPPDLDELVARVRALLRRSQAAVSPILQWGDLRLDPSQCEVSYGNHSLRFTPKEYALLELFLRNGQRVYNCNALLEQIWSFDDEMPGEDTIRTHIKGIRQKLKLVGAGDLIETVYGLGYRLNLSYAKQTGQTIATHPPSQAALVSASSQPAIVQI